MNVDEIPVRKPPLTLAAWQREREEIRQRFWQMLGDLPPLFTPQPRLLERATRDGCIVERFMFDNGADTQVYGYLLLPPQQTAPLPAVLYLHAHGHKYEVGKEELFRERVPGILPGPALAAAGYIVLAIDAYSFGERQQHGPAGVNETGAPLEQALFKHFLWRGASLWGMIVRDDLLALNLLLDRPEVDTQRVGLTGMSLGGSRTTWIGALDERPRALVPVAQMTRYRDFAATGRYNLHSVYYYLPGALKTDLDMEHLVALAAPRPQTILIGDQDPLSPLAGIHKIHDYIRHIYTLYDAPAALRLSLAKGIDHRYTPEMFAEMLAALPHP